MPLKIKNAHDDEWEHRLASEILEIGLHCASLPELDNRAEDKILGYNERGVWTL